MDSPKPRHGRRCCGAAAVAAVGTVANESNDVRRLSLTPLYVRYIYTLSSLQLDGVSSDVLEVRVFAGGSQSVSRHHSFFSKTFVGHQSTTKSSNSRRKRCCSRTDSSPSLLTQFLLSLGFGGLRFPLGQSDHTRANNLGASTDRRGRNRCTTTAVTTSTTTTASTR